MPGLGRGRARSFQSVDISVGHLGWSELPDAWLGWEGASVVVLADTGPLRRQPGRSGSPSHLGPVRRHFGRCRAVRRPRLWPPVPSRRCFPRPSAAPPARRTCLPCARGWGIRCEVATDACSRNSGRRGRGGGALWHAESAAGSLAIRRRGPRDHDQLRLHFRAGEVLRGAVAEAALFPRPTHCTWPRGGNFRQSVSLRAAELDYFAQRCGGHHAAGRAAFDLAGGGLPGGLYRGARSAELLPAQSPGPAGTGVGDHAGHCALVLLWGLRFGIRNARRRGAAQQNRDHRSQLGRLGGTRHGLCRDLLSLPNRIQFGHGRLLCSAAAICRPRATRTSGAAPPTTQPRNLTWRTPT